MSSYWQLQLDHAMKYHNITVVFRYTSYAQVKIAQERQLFVGSGWE